LKTPFSINPTFKEGIKLPSVCKPKACQNSRLSANIKANRWAAELEENSYASGLLILFIDYAA
jgi:hypothetical protein